MFEKTGRDRNDTSGQCDFENGRNNQRVDFEMNDLVSIIMPSYNTGKYIANSINSVLNQTYQDWELIIVDDGSDDEETVCILNDISDDQIVVYHTDHLRPAGARNYGIKFAKGKYILPVDSDDKIDPVYMEKAVGIIESNPQVGVVYCQADLFGEQHGRWELPDYSFKKMLLDNIVFVTALFYKSDWEMVGGFNTTMADGMEDYDFWLSIMALGREIYQIPEVLFHYRIKPVSRTTNFQKNCEQVQETYRQMYMSHRNFYGEHRDEYAMVLRDALIEQIFLRRKYEERWAKIVKFASYPIIGKMIRRLINE